MGRVQRNDGFYSLGQAAKATGKGKTTILNALKDGRISFVEKTADGYKIDPAELHRVYPPVGGGADAIPPRMTVASGTLALEESHQKDLRLQEAELKLAAALERIRDREDIIEDLTKDRDQWRGQCSNLIEDKRSREAQEASYRATLQADDETLRKRLEVEETRRRNLEQRLFEEENAAPKVGIVRKIWRGIW
jgi:hypothetical protein